MAQALGPYTIRMWEKLPADGKRYELLDGRLIVTPSAPPPHQLVVLRLTTAIGRYMEKHRLGTVWPGGDVYFGGRTVFEPDVVAALGPAARKLTRWRDLPDPALAVEVLSPSSARYDRGPKRRRYLRRAAEYWVVDAKGRQIEVWRREDERPTVVRDRLTWRPRRGVPALTISLSRLFADLP